MISSGEDIVLISSTLIGLAVFLGALWLGPMWDVVGRRQVADLTPRLVELNVDTRSLARWMRWWGLAMVGAFLFCWLVLGIPLLGILAVGLLYIMPRAVLNRLVLRRQSLLRDQMVGAAVTLANATRAGLALAQGLETIARELPDPLASEFGRITRDYERGRPLADALRDAKSRLNLDGFTLFVNAILTCLERGGKVTDALERISRSLQESQRLERKLEADTASGRKVVLILGIFPIAFLGVFCALDMETMSVMFTTLIGQIILVLVAGMVYGSVRWAKRIMAIEI